MENTFDVNSLTLSSFGSSWLASDLAALLGFLPNAACAGKRWLLRVGASASTGLVANRYLKIKKIQTSSDRFSFVLVWRLLILVVDCVFV
jgi:hypothetical protein